MTGNGESSLGLHPAIYFYSEQGKNMADMFLGIAYLVKLKKVSNDDGFFKKFTGARAKLEEFLRDKKALVSAILFQIRSSSRIERVGDMIAYLVTEINAGKEPTIEGMAAAAKMKGNIVALREKVAGKTFSDETKSAIYLRQSLAAAMRCPICNGYLEPESSASYDHVKRKQNGGTGDDEKDKIAHPYCNTGFKN